MAFFSMLAAVALEHWRPLRRPLLHYQYFGRYTQWLDRRFNAGESLHGAIAWALAVLPLLAGVWGVYALLSGIAPFLGWLWSVAALYAMLGFKYYSDDAERIAHRLREGDLEGARTLLAEWRGGDTLAFSAGDIARVTIEQTIAASHRQMFGVLFWFIVLSGLGPVGAVLFRASSILSRRWAGSGRFGRFARATFHAINWLPARLTALTYAIAGNFEDASFSWRTQAEAWPDAEEGVVIAAGAGAMGVKLGQALNVGGDSVWRPDMGVGQEAPDSDCIDSAVSMVWRGLVIWLIAGLLIVVAGWVA